MKTSEEFLERAGANLLKVQRRLAPQLGLAGLSRSFVELMADPAERLSDVAAMFLGEPVAQADDAPGVFHSARAFAPIRETRPAAATSLPAPVAQPKLERLASSPPVRQSTRSSLAIDDLLSGHPSGETHPLHSEGGGAPFKAFASGHPSGGTHPVHATATPAFAGAPAIPIPRSALALVSRDRGVATKPSVERANESATRGTVLPADQARSGDETFLATGSSVHPTRVSSTRAKTPGFAPLDPALHSGIPAGANRSERRPADARQPIENEYPGTSGSLRELAAASRALSRPGDTAAPVQFGTGAAGIAAILGANLDHTALPVPTHNLPHATSAPTPPPALRSEADVDWLMEALERRLSLEFLRAFGTSGA